MTYLLENEKLVENLIREKQKDINLKLTCNPLLSVLITGVCDEDSLLSMFAGVPQIMGKIWSHLLKYWWRFIYQGDPWDFDIADDGITPPFLCPFRIQLDRVVPFFGHRVFPTTTDYFFPEPTGINITMMPFTMACKFEETYLPDYLKPYWDGILGQHYIDESDSKYSQLVQQNERELVGYLTIREGLVKANETQGKTGLHTLNSGTIQVIPDKAGHYVKVEEGSETWMDSRTVECKVGEGSFILDVDVASYDDNGILDETDVHWVTENLGGAFIATNVSNAYKLYNCCILQDDETFEDIIGDDGDIQFLKDVVPEDSGARVMEADKMYWITDRTPIMALPLKEDTHMQYIQLVTSKVAVWYEEHYTKNPRGMIPDPTITKVIKATATLEKS